jgi:hypothetical protein
MADAVVETKLLLVGSVVAFGVAALLVLGVIPQVRVDPLANRDAASMALLVNAILNIATGIALLTPVLYDTRFARAVLLSAALLGYLLGFALLDAAFAFLKHPGMMLISAALSVCTVAEVSVGILAVIAASDRRWRADRSCILARGVASLFARWPGTSSQR